jgi:S-DNA-T family DNA segregation ATPase FtsK/SpoIIIE
MAQRKTTTSRTSTSRGKSTRSRGGTSRNTTRSRPSSRRQSSSRRPSRSKSPTRKPAANRDSRDRGNTRPAPPPPPLVSRLTLDRKLDIAGVILTLLGLLLFLSLVSAERNALFAAIFRLLAGSFGWGGYLLPLGLFGIGLWLILRNFERVPGFDPERLTGITLLFGNLVTALHFLAFPVDADAAYALAAAGKGGGYLGAFISETLLNLLGFWGAAIALLAWLIIGFAFALDVTVADLFRWLPPLADLTRRQAAGLAGKLAQPRGRNPAPGVTAPGEGRAAPVAVPFPAAAGVGLSLEQLLTAQNWVLPPLSQILEVGQDAAHSDDVDRQNARLIEDTLASFGAPATVVEIKHGPAITMFGVEPDFIATRTGQVRVRVSKIASLADDLALAMAASRIRIQAPVPGEGYVGIEVPNENISLVSLRDVIESEPFKKMPPPLRFALGQDVAGTPVAANLAAMPHLLIAGATGSGKSVCVNAIICCYLMHNTPDDMRMIMVDPKRVELTNYNGIPHLLAPVVVEMDRVVGALQWVTREMDARYQKFHDSGTRNITEYNRKLVSEGGKKIPFLVVVIDELADLMILAPDQTEKAVTRLAQLARATGIHLIIATQRPSVDVVTGLIKANFPARIAFAVTSGVDSRVILDQPGADRLLGRGDMLFQAPDAAAPVRLQGVYVSDEEINRLTQFWRMQTAQQVDASTMHSTRPADAPSPSVPLKQAPMWDGMDAPADDTDPMFNEAVDIVRRQGRASVSMLQRRLRIGYTRAARLVETMEDRGIVGPPEGGAQTREVLDYGKGAPPVDEM